jgi:hypothetical protein
MSNLLPSFIDKEFEILEIREDKNEEGYCETAESNTSKTLRNFRF